MPTSTSNCPIAGHLQINAVDRTGLFGIRVVRELRIEVRADQQAACQAHGEADDVDKMKGTVPDQVAPGDGNIILDHNGGVRDYK